MKSKVISKTDNFSYNADIPSIFSLFKLPPIRDRISYKIRLPKLSLQISFEHIIWGCLVPKRILKT